jgi:hypothetical protein
MTSLLPLPLKKKLISNWLILGRVLLFSPDAPMPAWDRAGGSEAAHVAGNCSWAARRRHSIANITAEINERSRKNAAASGGHGCMAESSTVFAVSTPPDMRETILWPIIRHSSPVIRPIFHRCVCVEKGQISDLDP